MGIQKDKEALRELVKERNKTISDQDRIRESSDIFRQVEELRVFQDAQYVMVYWSLEDEVFTHDFILKWCGKKHILLPVIRGEDLEVIKYTGPDNMVQKEPYFIPEPVGDIVDPGLIEVIIVPGRAFDFHNHRLGRGKAYYDKFLKTTSACKLGVCLSFQLFDHIPVVESDVHMDKVLSGNVV